MAAFYGKYRGTVANNLDPLQLGRLQVAVPAVATDGRLVWAMPCVPYAGHGVGFVALPPIGANVWVEYEGGNPDEPIWAGCFWANGETPVTPMTPNMKCIKTEGISLIMDNTPGGGSLTIQVGPPVTPQAFKIIVDTLGIKLAAGASVLQLLPAAIELQQGAASVKLSPISVNINNGALEVT